MQKTVLLSLGVALAGWLGATGLSGNGLAPVAVPVLALPHLPAGTWPAVLFGGSFVFMLLALIGGALLGMARNAPPKPAKTPRHAAAAMPETMQPV